MFLIYFSFCKRYWVNSLCNGMFWFIGFNDILMFICYRKKFLKLYIFNMLMNFFLSFKKFNCKKDIYRNI